MAQVANMTGRPRLFQSLDVMGWRVFSESVVTMILAVEPMIVPLPPKPAPKASAHHSGVVSIPVSPSPMITGIIAIVIGTLSTTADTSMFQSANHHKESTEKDQHTPFNAFEDLLNIRLYPNQCNGSGAQRNQ